MKFDIVGVLPDGGRIAVQADSASEATRKFFEIGDVVIAALAADEDPEGIGTLADALDALQGKDLSGGARVGVSGGSGVALTVQAG